eukprot:5940767-Alexandrium_andersonii.AAC.1
MVRGPSFNPPTSAFSSGYAFKAYAEAHNPTAGGCGPSAQTTRNSLTPGPNSKEIGTPMILSLALEAPREA